LLILRSIDEIELASLAGSYVFASLMELRTWFRSIDGESTRWAAALIKYTGGELSSGPSRCTILPQRSSRIPMFWKRNRVLMENEFV
jgi:hypothetical protein